MHALRHAAAAEGGRLLRVLLVRFGALSTGAASRRLRIVRTVKIEERELQQVWYGGTAPPLSLRLLALLFDAARRLHAALHASGLRRTQRLRVPVVVVGNITAGGTGKTPLTIALAEALRARGFRPGVISRGYGGRAHAAQTVATDSDPLVVGDEACLIARATGVPVAIAHRRADAGRLLIERDAVDVLIADDGLQHRALARDIEICVVDGVRRFGNGRLLPAGPLREPTGRLEKVDFVVCNGGTPEAGEVPMTLAAAQAVSLSGAEQQRPLSDFAGQRVHAVAGIGNPARFFTQLRALGIEPIEHAFADHHAFTRADIVFGDDLPVLMTEKDAVKCRAFADARHWSVPVRAVLPQAFFDEAAGRLRRG
jgi:tetraacyldisaccharide 4'-kinase